MKKGLLVLFLGAFTAHAQQTIHSTSNGNASNPLIWDCFCFPTPDDIVIIDHQVTMDVDWLVNSAGRIEVSSGASLSQDADRQLLIDGSGSQLIINGTAVFTDIAFTNGSSGSNSGNFSVDRGLYFGAGTTFTNTSDMNSIDSLMTEGTFTNSGNCFAGNFLNTGTFTNTGHIAVDSMGNTGTFNYNGGYLVVNVFGNSGTYTMQNQGFMDVAANWYNSGDFTVGNGITIAVGGNAYTGDTLGGTANLTVDGGMTVAMDFGCSDDLNGSGDLCVGGYSTNVGNVTGTLDFCDQSAISGFDLNLGSIAGMVTFCTSGCAVGTTENEMATITVWPNPASENITFNSSLPVVRVEMYTLTGAAVSVAQPTANSLAVSGLSEGVYLLKVITATGSSITRVVVER